MIDIKDIKGNVIYSTPINQGSKRKFELMQADHITLRFSLDTPINFPIGCYVDDSNIGLFERVDNVYKPKYNNSTGGYDYELQLEAYYRKWKNKIFKFTPEVGGQEASWSLTASLDVHMGIFLRNLKALGYTYRGNEFEFAIDSTVENKAVSMTYDNMNMLDALLSMAESWGCEVWVTDNVIHFGRCEYGTPVDFELNVNVAEMTRSESKSVYATRIYAFGSTKNLPANYRPVDESVVVNGIVQRRLMLPKGTPYVDAFEGLTEAEAIEQVVIFDDVYPRTQGSIDSVETYDSTVENEDGTATTETFYRFKDSGITFSKDYILEGEELRIKFESGLLNGMEFGLVFNPEALPEKIKNEETGEEEWNPEAQLFEIVASEDYGRKLPDSTLKPQVGDTYILIGWDSTKIADLGLISNAENELLAKAQQYVEKSKVDPNTYQCKMMSDYMYGLDSEGNLDTNYAKVFEVGDRVNLINEGYFDNGRQSRIIGYEYNLDYPYDNPIYTVGETASYSRIGDIESKLDALTYGGQTYNGVGGSGVYVIGTNDNTTPSNRNVYSALKSDQRFLRKDKPDTAKEKITFEKGVEVGSDKEGKGITYDKETKKATAIIDELKKLLLLQSDEFLQGELGSGFILKYDKKKKRSYLEVDEVLVRKIFYVVSLIIKHLQHVGGTIILTPASMKCSKVEKYDTYYRCYFDYKDDDKAIKNEFEVGDLARCQTFNIIDKESENVSNQYYWRYVTGVGADYIDLSIADCDEGSKDPMKGDEIVQLGNRSNTRRQNAIILSTIGDDAPSIKQYKGIYTYELNDDMAINIFSSTKNKMTGEFISEATKKPLEDIVNELKVDWEKVREQTDQEFTIWFFDYEPSLDNYPAVEWYNEELKEMHDQDIFYDKSSGRAYRFEDGLWVEITDADTIAALEKAAKAQESANKAQSTADYASNVAKDVTERVNSIVADNILSAVEKKSVRKEFEEIMAEYARNINAAEVFGITIDGNDEADAYIKTYESNYIALGSYMNDGSWSKDGIPSWISDANLGTNQQINPDEYRSVWVSYYDSERGLLNYIAELSKKVGDDVTNKINNIVKDGILSALEKKEVLKEFESIMAEYSKNESISKVFKLDDDAYWLNYKSAYFALGSYMNDGSWDGSSLPKWLSEDLSKDTSITASEYRSAWVGYYESSKDFSNHLSELSKDRIDEIVADGVLSALEKKEVLKEWETITANYSENIANATKYAVSYTNYQSAYESLGTYLNGGNAWNGGTPLWLQELNKNQPINSSDYREYWVDYYREEKILADAISEAIKKIADSKKKTFVSQPTDSDSYKVGDMWVNAYYDDGVTIYVDETLVCVQDKNVGEAFSISHWSLSNGYSASIRNLGDKVVIKSEYEKYQSELTVKFDGITAITSQFITNENGEIVGVTQSGLVSKSDFSTLFAQYVEEGEIVKRAELDVYVEKDKDGNIVSGIKLRADQLLFEAEDGGEIKLSADNINLNGAVSFAMFDTDLQSTINGKASSDALDEAVLGLNNTLTLMQQDINGKASTSSVDSLTQKYNELNDELSKKYDSDGFEGDFEYYLNNLTINAAVSGSTLIVNGYINTDLIKTDTLIAKQVITDSDGTNYMVLRDGSLETRRASDDRTWFWINTGDNGVNISMMDGYDNHTVLQSNYVYLFNNSEGSSFIGTSKGVSFGSNLNRVSFESEGYDGVISVPAGKFRIVSAYWPKEANVGSGEMYVDGSGYVKVKSANLS